MVQHPYSEKIRFINDKLLSFGLSPYEVDTDEMCAITLYRKRMDSLFVLVTVSYDFRDEGWSVRIEVGQGFPEHSKDMVEYQIAAIAVSDINEKYAVPLNLKNDLDTRLLKEIFEDQLSYCESYIAGKTTEALSVRSERNRERSIDPLLLDTENSHVKDQLHKRNEELKYIYQKYL